MVFGPASTLGVSLFEETAPVERTANSSSEDLENIIRAVYRQVLGNAYVMESERATVPESQFKLGELSVREFVRAVAKSDVYKSRFFDTCPRYRFIELNFKHLLGRTPEGLEETRGHSTILDTEGFEAEIDSYLNSDEYWRSFGADIVPHYRGYNTQTGHNLVGYTRSFQLVRSMSSSDKATPESSYGRLENSLLKGDTKTAAALLSGVDVAKTIEPKPEPTTTPKDAPIMKYGSVSSYPSSNIYSAREVIRRTLQRIT